MTIDVDHTDEVDRELEEAIEFDASGVVIGVLIRKSHAGACRGRHGADSVASGAAKVNHTVVPTSGSESSPIDPP